MWRGRLGRRSAGRRHLDRRGAGHDQTLLDLFDHDGSGTIEVDELRNDDLISSMLIPDIDLFDAVGTFNPRTDGVKDSLSIGVGLTCVPATFTTP